MIKRTKLDDRYDHSSHSKGTLAVHFVFVVKYRKKLLRGTIDDDCKQALLDVATENGWRIETMETDIDHIHLLVRYGASVAVSEMAKAFKQKSGHELWKRHEKALSREFWKKRVFWSSGYFYCSVGEASADTIRKYIETQG